MPLNSTFVPSDVDERITKEQLSALMSPLHPRRVKTRQQGGVSLSYVEAYDIKATLIRLFGFGGFDVEVLESYLINVRETDTTKDGKPKTPQAIAFARVALTVHAIGARYVEAAVGSNSGWDIGDICDNAIKTAESDALKRCATYLGTQFGLSLYDGGNMSEIVGVILEPRQRELLAEVMTERKERYEQAQAEQAENLKRALGAEQNDLADAVKEVQDAT